MQRFPNCAPRSPWGSASDSQGLRPRQLWKWQKINCCFHLAGKTKLLPSSDKYFLARWKHSNRNRLIYSSLEPSRSFKLVNYTTWWFSKSFIFYISRRCLLFSFFSWKNWIINAIIINVIKEVLDNAVKMINFVKARPLKCRLLKILCEDVGSI